MSDDRSFMDKVLGRDEPSAVDTRDRDTETRDTGTRDTGTRDTRTPRRDADVPASRDHQDHLAGDHLAGDRRDDHLAGDRRDDHLTGDRRPERTSVDGLRDDRRQEQAQGQEQHRDVRVVDVRRDADQHRTGDPARTDPGHSDPGHSDPGHSDPGHSDAARSGTAQDPRYDAAGD
ncbi:hypothetical protein [Pseudonocardia pini]|uniref:hypothetical protein n=1 Tax=Pseudonocardia pini TaxID=2758030 RepID=UPI0015F01660|nr:hypothetical protein [Pseudonocardia pini]